MSQTYNLSSETQVQRRNQGIFVISLSDPATFPQKVFKHHADTVRTAKRHVVKVPQGCAVA